MTHSKCTLKDIALRCDVSTAIVSTVLNGKEGAMKCSAAKRDLILKTAKALEYHPNILARSIREKRIPIIGVFLRHSSIAPHVLGRTMSSRLGAVTTILNKMQYEVLFVPYSDPREQYSRMKSLIARGLLGGIITNIDFDDNKEVCRLLHNSKLPYLVLGKPALPDTYCVYNSNSELEKLCKTLADEQKCSRCISVEPGENDSLLCRAMPFPEGHIWAGKVLDRESVLQDMSRTFFVVMGAVLVEKMRKSGIRLAHYVCVDPEEDMDKLSGLHDTFFMKDPLFVDNYLEKVFSQWLLEDRKPEKISIKHTIPEENFIFKRKLSI